MIRHDRVGSNISLPGLVRERHSSSSLSLNHYNSSSSLHSSTSMTSLSVVPTQQATQASVAPSRARYLPCIMMSRFLGCQSYYSQFMQLSIGSRLLFVSSGLLLFIIVYMISVQVHTATYVWQMTKLGDFIEPVHRTTCDISPQTSSINTDNSGKYSLTCFLLCFKPD